MKYFYSFLLLTLMGSFMFAQAPQQPEHTIKFEEETHDFGEVIQGKPVTFSFSFLNDGEEPITLDKVKASCGCTTPKWTKEPVAASKKGSIDVSYNAARMGSFSKSVSVWYNGRTSPKVVFIKGKVIPDPAKPVASTSAYKVKRGSLSFEKVTESIGTFKDTEKKEIMFKFQNTSNKPVTITKTEGDPGFNILPMKRLLQPQEEGVIKVTIDGSQMTKEGYFYKQMKIFTDDDPETPKQFSVSGTLEKTAEPEEAKVDPALAPKIKFKETKVKGGTIIEGEKFVYDFVFTNEGKSPLEINSAKASCGCTASTPKDKVVEPGDESRITATFNSRGRVGKNNKYITVKTNDPENPAVRLEFTVEVVKDPFHATNVGPANK